MSVHAYLFDADGTDCTVELDEQRVPGLSDRQLLWIDVTGHDRGELERVSAMVRLEAESVRTLLDPIGRPRLDHYGGYFQVNVIAVQAERTSYRPVPLDFFAGPNYVLTAHRDEIKSLEGFREQVRGDTQIGQLTSASFVAALLDWHITSYFHVLDELEDEVERLDVEGLEHPSDRRFLTELAAMRRRVGSLRRMLTPHRDVFSALTRPDFEMIATSESAAHFRSLNDRFERAVDAIENARDLVIGSFELYMSSTAQQTNDVMRVLTLATVLLGIGAVVAGVMGMNFNLPIFDTGAEGFWAVVIGILASLAVMVLFAKLKRWI